MTKTYSFTVPDRVLPTGRTRFGRWRYVLTLLLLAVSWSARAQAPSITLAQGALPAARIGITYSQALTASGGTGPYTFALTGGQLPAGLSLSAGGVLSGTPTAGGTFSITVRATDSSTGQGAFTTPGPYSGSANLSLTVEAPYSFTPWFGYPDQGMVGVAYRQSFQAAGATAPYSFVLTFGPLPPGLRLTRVAN